ncbi:LysM peptidoglycan-binding domain-containing protein [Mucilaginibacter sp. JRF]|uniref:LysM peptidoglycan-binding domain-containing protein n=1 Tax=Mucilaginibacter sp. JRF TaxID=2780088 RepID=UPI00187DE84B|nr:LysM peptidoglycan-binding domain-containing protein [Mucilaginibacter sp. JRF]MBE9585850.1 LysM peptidoglycan-binding domain-containing protein [Mucilaginibacter sp. JRF]
MQYAIKSGDSLSKIAAKFKIPIAVLIAANKQIVDPNKLVVGQVIEVPNMADVPPDPQLVLPTEVSALLSRARSAINKGIRYKLGSGGMKPAATLPDGGGLCDCSGFVCWVLGLSRQTNIPFYKKYGGWIFTDSMVDDVNSSAGIFERITTPEPGCIVVYGAGKLIGHVGIVSEVSNGVMKKVIHCSSGNDRKFSDAIQETPPTVFTRPDSLWGKFTG